MLIRLGLPSRTRNGATILSHFEWKARGSWESENMQHYARFEAIGALHMELFFFFFARYLVWSICSPHYISFAYRNSILLEKIMILISLIKEEVIKISIKMLLSHLHRSFLNSFSKLGFFHFFFSLKRRLCLSWRAMTRLHTFTKFKN